jgi:AraC family transcriptional regulator of adaptative response / DNA-3-methyladenine glycosylase II
LSEIGGIGPWTIEYVALRGLGDPDAFPASDAAILRAYGGDASRAADTWRPFRAYAAMRLWRRAARLKGR